MAFPQIKTLRGRIGISLIGHKRFPRLRSMDLPSLPGTKPGGIFFHANNRSPKFRSCSEQRSKGARSPRAIEGLSPVRTNLHGSHRSAPRSASGGVFLAALSREEKRKWILRVPGAGKGSARSACKRRPVARVIPATEPRSIQCPFGLTETTSAGATGRPCHRLSRHRPGLHPAAQRQRLSRIRSAGSFLTAPPAAKKAARLWKKSPAMPASRYEATVQLLTFSPTSSPP